MSLAGSKRLDAHRDANQPEIVDALKRVNVAVEVIGKPVDLLICVRRPGGPPEGETSLMEVKMPDGTLTKDQIEFIARWPGKVSVVRSPEEAVRAALGEDVCS